MRLTAFAFALLTVAVAAALFLGGSAFLPEGAWPRSPLPGAPWEVLLWAGLVALPAGGALAVKHEQEGGALLLVGAAGIGLALAWHAGPHLNWYLPGLFLVVLPQTVSGTLFFLRGRRRAREAALKKPSPRRRR